MASNNLSQVLLQLLRVWFVPSVGALPVFARHHVNPTVLQFSPFFTTIQRKVTLSRLQ